METRHKPNPKLNAGFASRLFFGWLLPIFIDGKNHELKESDLYEVLPENLSEPITNRLENFWKVEFAEACKEGRKPSLLKAIKKTFRWVLLKYAVHFFFMYLVFNIARPITVGLLIWHFDERATSSRLEAYGYATAFVLLTLADQMLFSHTWFGLRSIGINARVACASLIYRKLMRLPHTAKQATGGKIINLLSNDCAKYEFCFLFLHILWILPVQVVLVTYLLWLNAGVAAFAGIVAVITQTIPVQAYSGKFIARLRRRIAMKTDERVSLTGEIVHGIRVIKMYTWEKPFEEFVVFARKYEIDIIAKAAYLKSVLWSIMTFAQRTPLFITVMIYVLMGNAISAYTMFTLVQYFNILHVMTGSYFLRAVSTLSEAIASTKRIQEFLLLEEQVPNVKVLEPNNENAIVSIKGVSASSVEKSDVNFLHDIDLCIRPKLLYAAVGPVGAGKSSLLKLILDELRPSKGEVNVYGHVSYASQEPWLFRGTLKRNILFSEPYNKDKYDRVTKACALLDDFEQLPKGDETLVGESGMTLSGGQCARVNLARAVYRDADIYLLDDPLSAVDSRVGKRLFEDCINGLLRDKTRILITHQLQYLKEADEIILIDNGRVEYQGNFKNFEKTEELFRYLNLNDATESEFTEKEESKRNSIISLNKDPKKDVEEDEEKEPQETEKLINGDNSFKQVKKNNYAEECKANIKKEQPNIYWQYFTASGSSYLLPITTFLIFVIAQFLCSGCDYFVAYWTRKEDTRLRNTNSTLTESLNILTNRTNSTYNSVQFIEPEVSLKLDPHTAIYIFGAFMIGIIIASVSKMVLFSAVCKNSNQKIHNNMAASLLRTTMQFFEKNDSGQILNRFSKDLGTVDERLQAMMLETVEFGFILLGVVIQIVIINSWTVMVILIMGILYCKGRTIAIKTSRGIMRLEGKAKSPVFSHVNSSFAGILTIRSCRASSIACKEFDILQDNHTAVAGISQYALQAYNFWLDLISLVFTAVLTYSFLIARGHQVTGADVGLAITQVLILCNILARAIKLTGDIETQMVSVERLLQYTELEPEEKLDEGAVQQPPSTWPSHGKIKFDNVSMRYSEHDSPVLKDLKFTIEAGAKIGIVGRTGAGKSSLLTALFRFATVDGSIFVDELDTKKIGLKYLRNKISILPQEPILFSISLRKNLDPMQQFDDASLWAALNDVELNNIFTSLDNVLDLNNLSTGQRQLLCLARAILRKNKILILDEATANVDASTESLIHNTIRVKFKDCTVLMIAHRLQTLKDCDKILVMNQGRLVEFDHPTVLMKQQESYFSKMLSQNVAASEQFKKISEEESNKE